MKRKNQKRQEEQKPAEAPEHAALRTCLVTRTVHPREHLLRFVVDPGGELVEDMTGRLPGRGVYVQPARRNLAGMLRRHGQLQRLSTQPLKLPTAEELQERLALSLTRRLTEGVGLARRGRKLLLGLREAERLLTRDDNPLLLLAGDASPSTREKLAQLIQRYGIEKPMELLDQKQLGTACGRETATLLALPAGGMAHRVRADAIRWQTFFLS